METRPNRINVTVCVSVAKHGAGHETLNLVFTSVEDLEKNLAGAAGHVAREQIERAEGRHLAEFRKKDA